MTEEPARYDALASGYARHWGPVIRPAAEALLDRIEPQAGARILDVGTGTGMLAIELLRRWPRAQVTGLDPSGSMLDLAGAAAIERLGNPVAEQFERVVGVADA
ncbi:MAG TPA: methyltransferase domain-containing protein, partial [Candidatus Limnocylindrales bacterium]|nr:methyltransferase domain-containing protein [Candidatus Limnocylindrales bacterium]